MLLRELILHFALILPILLWTQFDKMLMANLKEMLSSLFIYHCTKGENSKTKGEQVVSEDT